MKYSKKIHANVCHHNTSKKTATILQHKGYIFYEQPLEFHPVMEKLLIYYYIFVS